MKFCFIFKNKYEKRDWHDKREIFISNDAPPKKKTLRIGSINKKRFAVIFLLYFPVIILIPSNVFIYTQLRRYDTAGRVLYLGRKCELRHVLNIYNDGSMCWRCFTWNSVACWIAIIYFRLRSIGLLRFVILYKRKWKVQKS